MNIEVNKKLKIERAIKELSQTDVAKILGIRYSTYMDKENGKRDFTLTEIKKLMELFGKKFEELF